MIGPHHHALVALIPLLGAGAPAVSIPEAGATHATVRLISATTALTPGRVNELGLHIAIDRGWHLYWDGSNDSGFPLTAEWTVPAGFKVGAIRWPAPTRHVSPGDVLDHIYEDEVTLIVPLDVPTDASNVGTVTVSAKLAWLACEHVCVAENQTVTLPLPVASAGGTPAASKDAPLFDKARARLAQPLPKDKPPATFEWSKSAVEVRVPGAAELIFYPGKDCVRLANPIKDAQAKDARLVLTFPPVETGKPLRLQGILEVHVPLGPSRTAYYEVDIPGTP